MTETVAAPHVSMHAVDKDVIRPFSKISVPDAELIELRSNRCHTRRAACVDASAY